MPEIKIMLGDREKECAALGVEASLIHAVAKECRGVLEAEHSASALMAMLDGRRRVPTHSIANAIAADLVLIGYKLAREAPKPESKWVGGERPRPAATLGDLRRAFAFMPDETPVLVNLATSVRFDGGGDRALVWRLTEAGLTFSPGPAL